MLFILIALVYARWFFRSAKNNGKIRPVVWGVLGFFVFSLTGIVSSLGLSLLLMATQSYSPYPDGPGGFTALLIILSAIMTGNGFAFLFLPRQSSRRFADAIKHTSARRDLALPGKFPLGFASIFALTGSVGVILGMLLQVAIFGDDTSTIFNGQTPLFLMQAAGLAFIFQKYKNWREISLRWAAIFPFVNLIKYLLSLVGLGFFYDPYLFFFVSQYICFFIVAACITLSVQRWGASLPVLLGSAVLSRFSTTLLFTLPGFIQYPDIPLAVFQLFMSILWGAVLALCLYAGLLFHEKTVTPPRA